MLFRSERLGVVPTGQDVTTAVEREGRAPAPITLSNMKPGQQVTLYRGENAQNQAGGQWWTTDKAKAEKYGNVTEVTLPAEVIGQYAAQGHGGEDEFVFPSKTPTELAKTTSPAPVTTTVAEAPVEEVPAPATSAVATPAIQATTTPALEEPTAAGTAEEIGPRPSTADIQTGMKFDEATVGNLYDEERTLPTATDTGERVQLPEWSKLTRDQKDLYLGYITNNTGEEHDRARQALVNYREELREANRQDAQPELDALQIGRAHV